MMIEYEYEVWANDEFQGSVAGPNAANIATDMLIDLMQAGYNDVEIRKVPLINE